MHKMIVILTLCVLSLARPLTARAHDTVVIQQPSCSPSCGGVAPPGYLLAPPPREPASAFRSGVRGMLAGGIAGLSIGYLASRGVESERWRPLTFGAGVGALSGAGLGVGLGILDAGERRTGYYVARYMLYGTLFGGAVGGAAGGLSTLIGDGNGENALLGAAMGATGGLVLGMITGLIEGHRHDRARRHYARRFALQVAPTQGGFVSGVSGRF